MSDTSFLNELWEKFCDSFEKNFYVKSTQLTIAQVASLLEGYQPGTLTQVDIDASSAYATIVQSKLIAANLMDKSKTASNKVMGKLYETMSHAYEKLSSIYTTELNKIAKNNGASVSSNPFETLENISGKLKFNESMFQKFTRADVVENIAQIAGQFAQSFYDNEIDHSEAFANAVHNGLHLLNDAVVTTFLNEKLVPILDSWIAKVGLNPKTLPMLAAKGFGINLILTVEFEVVSKLAYKILDSDYVHLYDREWFVSASDWIFGNLDKIAIGSAEFDAVSSVYALLQANADKNYHLSVEEWNILFGSDEVRNMDIAKVKDVLASAVKIVTGKEITVNTTAVGEGYANAEGSSRYVTSLLLNLADELGDNSLLTFGKNLHQWNVVTNQKGVEVSAMDGDKTQFMLVNIGNYFFNTTQNKLLTGCF